MGESPENEGIPIYPDPVDRKLVDAAGEGNAPEEWHPMNQAADRLLKCGEALQDINEIMEFYAGAKAITKRRRRLRGVFVPLHSLCVNLVELLNQIQADKQVHDRLPANATATITQLRSHFTSLVPFDRKGKLGLLRNRVSAHYERSMSPAEMRDLFNSTDSTEIGEWLHITIGVLCDALKLDAYMWTAAGPVDGTVTMMCQEPLVSVIRIENSEVAGIGGFFMCKESPRMMVFQQIQKVAESSQCLFERKCNYRINGFYEDSKDEWARSLNKST
jgi:hypothetical protein